MSERKSVPREPTEAMMQAIASDLVGGDLIARGYWYALWDAAPTEPIATHCDGCHSRLSECDCPKPLFRVASNCKGLT